MSRIRNIPLVIMTVGFISAEGIVRPNGCGIKGDVGDWVVAARIIEKLRDGSRFNLLRTKQSLSPLLPAYMGGSTGS